MPFQRIPRVSDLLPGAIKGLWTIGDPTTWHVDIGTNTAGDSGIRLYGADGVTKLINLSIGATPTITGAIVQTAETGRRVVLDGPTDALEFYSGDVSETAPGSVAADVSTFRGRTSGHASVKSPTVAGDYGVLTVAAASVSASNAAGDAIDVWGNSFRDPAGGYIPQWSGGTSQIAIDGGSVSITTDAAGNAFVPVNLTGAPVVVVAQFGLSATAVIAETGSYVAGGFTVRLKTDAGAPLVTTGTLHYLAIGPNP